MQDQNSEYMTTNQAAQFLNVSREWVRKLAERYVNNEPNGIEAIRIGRDYLLKRAAVEHFQPNPVGWKKGRPRKRQNKIRRTSSA